MGSNLIKRVFFIHSVFISSIISADTSLDCFSCTDISSVDDCHATKTCSPTQSCYTEEYTNGGKKLYTLGCKEKVFCEGLDVTHLFGRRDTSCSQCCALHGCNKYLCPLRFTVAPPPVDGEWSLWGAWEGCSSTCGIGLQFRYRKCDNPAPSSNGRLCLGDAKDVGLCNIPCVDPGTAIVTDTPTTTTPVTTEKTTSPTTSHYNDAANSTIKYFTGSLTQAPGECKDLIDCSGYYRPESCHGIYSPWAHRYCPAHCGFCPTVSAPPCVDTIQNCKEYQSDVCTNQAFWQWRESHCRKYCGLC